MSILIVIILAILYISLAVIFMIGSYVYISWVISRPDERVNQIITALFFIAAVILYYFDPTWFTEIR